MSLENVEKLIKDNKVEFVDLRFVDMRGIEQHVTFPASIVDASRSAQVRARCSSWWSARGWRSPSPVSCWGSSVRSC